MQTTSTDVDEVSHFCGKSLCFGPFPVELRIICHDSPLSGQPGYCRLIAPEESNNRALCIASIEPL